MGVSFCVQPGADLSRPLHASSLPKVTSQSISPDMQAALSPVGEIVRRHDPDRFFTGLFAPAGKREALWALYAFNHEIARAREVVREPAMAMIRLQWWREVVEGARRRHEVAGPLREAIDAGALDPADLE